MATLTAADRTFLETFLDRTKDLFQRIVDARDFLFPQRVRDDINAAWMDIEKKNVIRDAKQAVSHILRDRAEEVGLSGPQLALKKSIFNEVWANFDLFGGKKWLKKLLEFINKLLDSLKVLFPPLEGVKEFKDAIEFELVDD
jgi:hypothetical protein